MFKFNLGESWDDFEKEIFTSKELSESNNRIALIRQLINKREKMKKDLIQEFTDVINNIDNFKNGKNTNRIAVLKSVNKLKRDLQDYLNQSFISRLKDKNGNTIQIGSKVRFLNLNQEYIGNVISYDRLTDKVTIQYLKNNEYCKSCQIVENIELI